MVKYPQGLSSPHGVCWGCGSSLPGGASNVVPPGEASTKEARRNLGQTLQAEGSFSGGDGAGALQGGAGTGRGGRARGARAAHGGRGGPEGARLRERPAPRAGGNERRQQERGCGALPHQGPPEAARPWPPLPWEATPRNKRAWSWGAGAGARPRAWVGGHDCWVFRLLLIFQARLFLAALLALGLFVPRPLGGPSLCPPRVSPP